MNALIIILNALLFGLLVWYVYQKIRPSSSNLFAIALLVRVAAAIVLGVLYRSYYSAGDTWNFFNDAVRVSNFARHDFFTFLHFIWDEDAVLQLASQLGSADRSLLLVKILTPFVILTGANYWLVAVWFGLISFVAAWWLFATIEKYFANQVFAAGISILFFPSVVFWSSGLIKENLGLAGLYMVLATVIRWFKGNKPRVFEWAVAAISFYVAWRLKYYWTALFAAVLVTTIGAFWITQKTKVRYAITWILIFITLTLLTTLLHPNFYLGRILGVIVENNQQFIALSAIGESIQYTDLQASWQSMVLNAPNALFSGLFRPFLWEAGGITAIAAALENTVLLILVLTGLTSFKRYDVKASIPLLVYSLVLCVFLALSSPNFGTLSRYRVGFLPFFVFLVTAHHPWLLKLQRRLNRQPKQTLLA